jgi:hypothetical protein
MVFAMNPWRCAFFLEFTPCWCFVPGTYLTPGEVIHSARDPGGCFDTGCYPNGSDSTAQAVAEALEQSHFAANADPKVMRLKHAKLLLNLGNPLQLILKDFNHSREIMRFLRQEALSCFEPQVLIAQINLSLKLGLGWSNQRPSLMLHGVVAQLGKALLEDRRRLKHPT